MLAGDDTTADPASTSITTKVPVSDVVSLETAGSRAAAVGGLLFSYIVFLMVQKEGRTVR